MLTQGYKSVVRTPDTDILVILLHYTPSISVTIFLDTGIGKNRIVVNISELAALKGQQFTTIDNLSGILSRLSYFSDWYRAKKAMAWVRHILPQRINTSETKDIPGTPKPLKVEEIEMAETTILKLVQEDAFEKEIEALKGIKQEQLHERELARTKKSQIKQASSLYRLDPFIGHDGLVRVGGRLRKAEEITEEEKHPIILPKKGHITDLIIRHAHRKVAHGGRGMTINELRRKYWVTNASAAVRRIITNCVTCKKLRGKVGEQKMSDLP